MNPRRLPGFASFYRAHFPGFRQQHRGFAQSGITLVRASQSPHSSLIPAVSEWRITQSLSGGAPLRRQIGGRWQEGTKPAGSFSLAPPDLAIPVDVLAPYRVRVLAIDAARLHALVAAAGAPGASAIEPLVDTLMLRDKGIECLLDAFWAEAVRDDPVARLLADGMAATLAARLLRIAGFAAVQPDASALAPRRLRRALDFIEAHLADDIGLADIAEAAGLSPYHFARAFRAATGLPPYRYVTQKRIARAQRLIAQTELSLAQVAFESGFGSQAQFTTAFTRLVGTSPGRWRADRRR
ncbi:helix-turn-helix domain-containing protein [Elioraea rosea]|uniref:helix-turn-helix domain-containing protein n=1 Tax=Elioraea rosea TaxID=2492390 RepID=UPI001182B314|nr:AraC family transcriptional regulator [Elioraea rosea]